LLRAQDKANGSEVEQMTRVLAIIFAVAFVSSAHAYTTGNELLAACDAVGDLGWQQRARCIGYIIGVHHGYKRGWARGYTAALQDKPADVCLPSADVTYGQIRDIAVRALRTQPEHRHLDADGIIIEALRKAFPCPK
jgi:Rap1a immunity proteins